MEVGLRCDKCGALFSKENEADPSEKAYLKIYGCDKCKSDYKKRIGEDIDKEVLPWEK
jgi:formate dehydrogenase maturation protein FdhE